MPALPVARRHDVDVAVEDQRTIAPGAEGAGHEHRIAALDLHSREARMLGQEIEVGLEAIDIQAGSLHRDRHPILRRALRAGDRRNSDEVLHQPDACGRVERLQRPRFSPLLEHGSRI